VNLEMGLEASALPTTDISSLPKSYWGKASTSNGGWDISARADVDAQDLNDAELEIIATNASDDLEVSLNAAAGKSFAIRTVEASKGLRAGDGTLTVQPKYDLQDETGEVTLSYDNGDRTTIELTASNSAQSVTISQQVDADNRIAPTLTSEGKLSVEWEKSLGEGNSLTATLSPDDAIELEWEDGAWTASINLPIDGTSITGADVSIKRDVNF